MTALSRLLQEVRSLDAHVCDCRVQNLISQLLVCNPTNRITAPMASDHPLFGSADTTETASMENVKQISTGKLERLITVYQGRRGENRIVFFRRPALADATQGSLSLSFKMERYQKTSNREDLFHVKDGEDVPVTVYPRWKDRSVFLLKSGEDHLLRVTLKHSSQIRFFITGVFRKRSRSCESKGVELNFAQQTVNETTCEVVAFLSPEEMSGKIFAHIVHRRCGCCQVFV